jgi:hypothetical protein
LSLNLAKNSLYAEGTKVLVEALKGNQVMTELNLSSNAATWDGKKHGEMSGFVALAEVIPDMGTLVKLDISSNSIGDEQEGGLQRICVASGIELAK